MLKNRIGAFLKKINLTQTDFAQESGLNRANISKLVNDPTIIPRGDTLGLLCDAYKLHPLNFIEYFHPGRGNKIDKMLYKICQILENKELSQNEKIDRAIAFLESKKTQS